LTYFLEKIIFFINFESYYSGRRRGAEAQRRRGTKKEEQIGKITLCLCAFAPLCLSA